MRSGDSDHLIAVIGDDAGQDVESLQKAIALYQTNQYSVSEVTDLTGISKNTLYRAINGRF